MIKMRTISHFRDQWLEVFFHTAKSHRRMPADLMSVLARKLDIINATASYRDLRSPPSNRYEELSPPLNEYSSIRVNGQYRLIFIWRDGKACNVYFDSQAYTKHR